MKNLAAEFLSLEEQEKVTATVHEMELQSSGEIVPLITTASSNYPLSAVIASAITALPIGLLGAEVLLYNTSASATKGIALFLFLTSLTFTGVLYLLRTKDQFLTIKKHFLLAEDVESEVEEAALAAFYSEGLYRTKAENGVLLYISVLEQKVWILADKGINDKIPENTWKQVVDQLTTAIKMGENCKGICTAIEQIGAILKDHFPHQKDDQDELNNLIIRG